MVFLSAPLSGKPGKRNWRVINMKGRSSVGNMGDIFDRDSTRFDEMKEGLISIGGRNLRLPLHF